MMGNPAKTVINYHEMDINSTEPCQDYVCDTSSSTRAMPVGDNTESERNNSQHRKKKRHRHRSRSNPEGEPNSEHGATSGGHDGSGEDSSESNENIVVSSSIRKKRSKARHHKHSPKDTVSGDDSGLSLGNSLNDSTVVGEVSQVTPTEETIQHASGIDTKHAECPSEGRTEYNDNVPIEDSQSDSVKHAVHTEEKKDITSTSSNNHPVTTDLDVSKTKESNAVQGQFANIKKQQDTSDSKKTDRMNRQLERQKSQYRIEKEMLKKRLDETRTKFQEEISKYEQDLSEHRKDYLEELSSLKLQEQYESLSTRISDLGQLEDDLDRRFKDCIEQQTDIEEMERFLNMREELCKSKERDITKLDDELDAWQNELEIKRQQLETADTSKRKADTSLNASYSKATTDQEDYILKKNLLKCQADLARTEDENANLHKQLDSLKIQLDSAKVQTQNHEKKIKQLENQLVIALSQLGSPKQNHLNQHSLPPINGHRPSVASSSAESRIEELQRDRASRRQLGKDHLSINQEAALRRKMLGKDSGVSTRSPSTSRISAKTVSSVQEQGLTEEYGRRSHASRSAVDSQSGEDGCQPSTSGASGEGTNRRKSPSLGSSNSEKSSVCALM
ncbi:myosin-2 heavy chain-like [Lytechinus pictus]|uniref:myosin-2 heavy chain-like n=1 Tax=Lytechinus pictus TaxID=7653 RepID=UPI0030BA22F9